MSPADAESIKLVAAFNGLELDDVTGQCADARFKHEMQIIARWNRTGESTKTLAVLAGQPNRPVLVAVSGWRDWAYQTGCNTQLRQAESLRHVKAIMRYIGHPFVRHGLDGNSFYPPEDGRYYACHAERQVVAHIALETEGTTPPIIIILSRVPCDDCWGFLARVELITGLNIRIYVDGVETCEQRSEHILRAWLDVWNECQDLQA